MDPWPGPDYFQNLKSNSTTWQEEYGKDEVTGRDSVFVKCASSIGSYWLQFDVESKLPVRAKCWYSNKKWEGEPTVASEHIVYNPEIPDDKFDFKIPPGAKVIDQRKATKKDEVKK
jgi:outer membrane lipoprotein-sorting protein